MIEAMACGTPVIAFRRGSAPEVIEDGVSGFLVETSPKPRRPPAIAKLIARRCERLSNVASTSNERLANMCKFIVGSLERKKLLERGNAMVLKGASLRFNVTIGSHRPSLVQKFQMLPRQTDASRPFRCLQLLGDAEIRGMEFIPAEAGA